MSKLAKTTIGLMIVTIVGKVLGFGRELALSFAYGTTNYSDAYITALNIPMVIFAAIGAALATTFIPLYYEAENNGGINESNKFANNILNIVALICIILSVIGIFFAYPLVKIFAVGFDGEKLELTVKFTRVLILGIAFIGGANIMTAILQIKNNFIIPGLTSIPFNIIIIISIIISSKGNIMIMIWGTLIAMASQFIFQIPFAYKLGYRYKSYLNLKDKYLNKMIILLGPVFIGVFVNQLNVLIDRTLASTLGDGKLSALNYANRLNGFVIGLFITSIASVIYPILSKTFSKDNKDQFNDIVVKSINSVILLIIPVTVGAIVLATPIVKILFERGAFNHEATQMTSIALVYYSIGLIGIGLRDILGKIFYSLKDTKTPMINGIITVIINIVLNIILVKFMGHAGLALATSISSIIGIILLFISLKNKLIDFKVFKIVILLIKSIISAIIMAVITLSVYDIISNIVGNGFVEDIIILLSSILSGAIVYLMSIIIFKVEEINYIIVKFKNKVLKK